MSSPLSSSESMSTTSSTSAVMDALKAASPLICSSSPLPLTTRAMVGSNEAERASSTFSVEWRQRGGGGWMCAFVHV
eukprot:CAMPEP_0113898276 /NCGR_PEP_ID=MMETSP0780_2-20120614/19265_1 /TAXON_ID=652834 /ORGANISM="Palpitomonas bilix" /LENGTH=76 /DNA_ID=CAMNT_0000890073 /DNA_START=481 /DNA_END=711 /DNA_ORIENTATION=+ /assembly_acc=CAM_ASM_000599